MLRTGIWGRWWLALVVSFLSSCAHAGACDPACSAEAFETCCAGQCVFLANDAQNCGGCGVVCAPGQRCENNMCVGGGFDAGAGDGGGGDCRPECPSGQRCCGTRCVNQAVALKTDGRSDPSFSHCGGCDIACDPEKASACSVPTHGDGAPRCMCGEFVCGQGQVCVSDPVLQFRCSELNDNANCGGVGRTCAPGETCSGGECLCGGERCAEGLSCCGGLCVDTTSDPRHCGGCDSSCGGTAPDCASGACTCAPAGRICDAPVLDLLGADLGESCCAGMGCVENSVSSCGCAACADGDDCQIDGSGLLTGGAEVLGVCCGGPEVLFLGCGPAAGGGGVLPLPSSDGGLPGADAGLPTLDGGLGDSGSAGADAGA